MKITIVVTDEPGGLVGIEAATEPPIREDITTEQMTGAARVADAMCEAGFRLLKNTMDADRTMPATLLPSPLRGK